MAGLSSCMASVLISSVLGGVGLPFGVPPGPEDAMMGRVAPDHCLFYLSWAETVSPERNSSNQTEQLLAEPEVQNFLAQIGGAIRKGMEKGIERISDAEEKELAGEALALAKSITARPGAFFITKIKLPAKSNKIEKQAPAKNTDSAAKKTAEGEGDEADSAEDDAHSDQQSEESPKTALDPFGALQFPQDIEMGAVFALGADAAALKSRIRSKFQKIASTNEPKGKFFKVIPLEGEDWYWQMPHEPHKTTVVFGFRGNYMIAASTEAVFKDILARMDKKPPQWWSDIREKLPIERRTITIYVDFLPWVDIFVAGKDEKELKEARLALDVLGLNNARAWIEVWGLEGRGFAAKSLLMLNGEPQGLLRLLSQRPLTTKDLALIPSDAGAAAVFRFDAQAALDIVLSAAEKLDPDARKTILDTLAKIKKDSGIDLRGDVLKGLGDTWCVYASTNEGGWPITVVSLRDAPRTKAIYERLMKLAQQSAPKRDTPLEMSGDLSNMQPQLEKFAFAGHDVYCLNYGPLAPAWCMTKGEIVFGLSPQSVKAFLARGKKQKSLASVPVVAELFSQGKGPMGLAYCDATSLFRFCYNILSFYSPAITNGLRQGGCEVDLSLMPSPPAIYRHLDPSIATFRRSKYGIEFVSRNTLPLPNVNGWFAMMALTSYGSTVQGVVSAQHADAPAAETQPAKPQAEPSASPYPPARPAEEEKNDGAQDDKSPHPEDE